jgi:hypothetical protein
VSNRAKARKISHALNYDYPSHSYPITAREARKIGLNIRDLGSRADELLRELNHVYAEMAHSRTVDFDPQNYHNGEICNILELVGRQVFYQVDKDWHYRSEEKRWVPMHDQSGWYLCTESNGRWTPAKFFIR